MANDKGDWKLVFILGLALAVAIIKFIMLIFPQVTP